MEFLSPEQLQLYDSIIEEINSELEKHDRLEREIASENDKLVISQLANSDFRGKVSHVNVKIFDNLFELCRLYETELSPNVKHKYFTLEDCSFFLIEIFLTKILMQTLAVFKGVLCITVKNALFSTSKVVNLTKSSPVYEVVPVAGKIPESTTIEVDLVVPLEQQWIIFTLDTIHTDISFQFFTAKDQNFENKTNNNLLDLAQSYNVTLNTKDFLKASSAECGFICDITRDNFVKTFIRNAYHKLDMEVFSELTNDSTTAFSVQFYTQPDRKHSITYNLQTKTLVINSNVHDLCSIKKYFLKEFHAVDSNKGDINLTIRTELKELSADYPQTIERSHDKLRKLYQQIRNVWMNLPI